MKTLEEIKFKVAFERGYDSWLLLIQKAKYTIIDCAFNEVAKEHAKQMCEHQRELCSDNAKLMVINGTTYKGPLKMIDNYTIINAPLATDNK